MKTLLIFLHDELGQLRTFNIQCKEKKVKDTVDRVFRKGITWDYGTGIDYFPGSSIKRITER